MSKPENLDSSDSRLWRPKITLRPHHFNQPDIQQLLVRRRSPEQLAESVTYRYNLRKTSLDKNFLYWRDVLGKNGFELYKYRLGIHRAYSKIEMLTDEDIIQFDLRKDDFCRSCIVGDHCMATNYDTKDPAVDCYEVEVDHLEEIVEKLDNRGYQYGVDYVRRKTFHTLLDYEGREFGPDIKPTKVPVEFESVLARVGPLRAIIEIPVKRKLSKPRKRKPPLYLSNIKK